MLERIKSGQTLLDLGCCFGQDLRRLVADGAPSRNLCGMDCNATFIDLGYDLFLDRETFEATFVVSDFLNDAIPPCSNQDAQLSCRTHRIVKRRHASHNF